MRNFRAAIVAIFFLWWVVNLSAIIFLAAFALRYSLGLDFLVGTVPQAAEQICQLISLALVGLGLQYVWRDHRLQGYRMLERAVIVQLFVGQLFTFINDSFAAVWAFLACLLMLVTVRFMIRQEARLQAGVTPVPVTLQDALIAPVGVEVHG